MHNKPLQHETAPYEPGPYVPDPAAIFAVVDQYPKPHNYVPSYGTAGFRDAANKLPSTVMRCGLLAAARARSLHATTGVMITASHNPIGDNGVKLIDPSGEMMAQSLEPAATHLACCDSAAEVLSLLEALLQPPNPALISAAEAVAAVAAHASAVSSCTQQSEEALEPSAAGGCGGGGVSPCVLFGYDTRPSALGLCAALVAGIEALGLQAVDCGQVTTPQLHYLVHRANILSTPLHAPAITGALPPTAAYSDTRSALQSSSTQYNGDQQQRRRQQQLQLLMPYDEDLLDAFTALNQGATAASTALHVDCANGVGAQHLQRLAPALAKLGLQLTLHNMGEGSGELNHGCGADFVQKERVLPAGFEGVTSTSRCCGIDGDADRLVYFAPLPGCGSSSSSSSSSSCSGGVQLLDGDKIAILAAIFIADLLLLLPPDVGAQIKVSIVQTAYANGASTRYVEEHLHLPVTCMATGVKHLHAAAHLADIGIYFEANGHGTVLFSQQLLARLRQVPQNAGARDLLVLSRMVNQYVGDALSVILLVETILRRKAWNIEDWLSLYTDLPSRQTKLAVSDRSLIITADAERRCVSPPGLQDAIDAAVAAVPGGRSFARPSGTEDAVRVYAEATTQAAANELAAVVGRAVFDLAGGVGSRP